MVKCLLSVEAFFRVWLQQILDQILTLHRHTIKRYPKTPLTLLRFIPDLPITQAIEGENAAEHGVEEAS